MAYISEYSFIATLKSVHPGYPAALDFSRLYQHTVNTVNGPVEEVVSDEYEYLCLTTKPRQTQKFWFLYHQWESGDFSYEIKAQHPMFHAEKRNFKSLISGRRSYITPDIYTPSAQGWRITWDNQCSCPPATKKPGKILYEVEPSELKSGTFGPVRLNSPEGNDLQVYSRSNFGDDWWAYVVDSGGITIPLSMGILQLGMAHPLE
jgi:hypothetical protein